MKRVGWILLGALLLAQPGQALKDTPAGQEPDARRSEFSSELDAFVRQAVDEGLLDPAGKAKPPGEPKSIVPKAAPQETPPVVKSVAVPPSGVTLDCSKPYPLDFTEYAELKQYSDIYAYREESGNEGQAPGTHAGGTLAKAYLALDLAAEAAMTVKTGRDPQSVAVQNLAVLLQGQGPAPAAYFAELAACYPQAGLWQALALLAGEDAAGAALMTEQAEDFAELPLQLRDRAAIIAIPALDAMNERKLAKLLLSSFSEEEIANSSQLQFSEAVLDLGESSPEAEQRIEGFLIQAHFQEAALASLVRHKRPINSAVREILLDEVVTRIELAQKDTDVRADLRFVLDELSRNSMYEPMMRLADLPSLQSETAREELTRHLAASLQRDLASEDPLRNIAAIEALIKDKGLLDGMPDRAALYETATVVAVRLGFGSLGDTLASKAKGGEEVAVERAVLAYRQKNYEELYGLAETYPANQRINRIAALAAIDARERQRLTTFESRLSLDPETILALIEQDASTSHWLVSERFYQAALKLDGDDQQWRVDRVMVLKALPEKTLVPERMAMSAISGKLDSSRASLAQFSGETP